MLDVQAPAVARAAAGLPSARYAVPMPQRRMAECHLTALMGRADGALIEVRCKAERGMRQFFFTDARSAAMFACDEAASTDVYYGVIRRSERAGGRAALVDSSLWVWAECDTETALVRALDMRLPPPLIVRSSWGKGHCYWPLSSPLPLDLVERANRRLAFHLGADPRATDAARILRVAGTFNHKYEPATAVAITRWEIADGCVRPSDLVGELADPSPPKSLPTSAPARKFGKDGVREQLLELPAREFVFKLTGREVLHDMATCPFHSGGRERTPSLHVGGPAGNLWHCFGCNVGGDVFTFAAKLWGVDDRSDFPRLKTRLVAELA